MAIERAEVIARMRGAFRTGLSATRFIADMKAAGLSYRRSDMLADWRSESNIEKKTDLLRFVRKDRVPTPSVYANVTYDMDKEFMYKIKSLQTLYPGEPVRETFVNIMQDVPRTPEWLEQEAWERSFKQSPTKTGEERRFIVVTALHKVEG